MRRAALRKASFVLLGEHFLPDVESACNNREPDASYQLIFETKGWGLSNFSVIRERS